MYEKEHVFSDLQVVTATAISTHVKETKAAAADFVDLGTGSEQYHGEVLIVSGLTGGTSIDFQFVSATNAALSSSVRVHWSTGAIVSASIVTGARWLFTLPPNGGSAGEYQQYIGMKYVVVGSPSPGATVFAGIGIVHPHMQTRRIFAHGQVWS